VTDLLKNNAPVAWNLLITLAIPIPRKPRKQPPRSLMVDEEVKEKRVVKRVLQNPELVVTEALSSIAYSCHKYAKLLPLEKALLLCACCAN
jgi:hypothetical protein